MQIGDLVRQFTSTQTSSDGKATRTAKNTERAPQPSGRTTVDTSSLQKGQTFEGSVSSIKGDRVTLSLSNGGTISARLSADVPLTEGESIFFEVKSNDGNLVNIHPVSIGAAQNPILMAALSTASLPQSESNIQMVNAMMQEQLPVDAKSLGDMARAVAAHPNTDMNTLVTMQKVGLPLTDEMIQQFENYKESEGAILETVTELVDQMTEAFAGEQVSTGDVASFAKNLMSILTSEEGVMPHLFDADGNQILAPAEGEGVPVETAVVAEEGAATAEEAAMAAEETGQAAAAAAEDGGEVVEAEAKVLPQTEAASAMEQTAPLEIGEGETKAGLMEKLSAIKQELAGLTETPEAESTPKTGAENAALEGKAAATEQAGEQAPRITIQGAEADPDIQKLLAETPGEEAVAYPKHSVGDTLDSSAQRELVSLLKEMGMPTEELVDENGNLRPETDTTKLAQTITEHLGEHTDLPKDQVLKLLSSEPFKEILKDAMSQKWTLPPEKVADKDAVKNLYAKLSVDMERLSQVASEAAKGGNPISQAAESIKNNVDFINQINQAYTYIQLPLKLSGQQATGDLYVYSNKKRKIGEDDVLSAFLHFDLEHLGSTDISVKMKNKKVSTDFYMTDDVSFELIQKNLPMLQEKLEKLGYSCSLNVNHDEEDKKVDFVEDFLKAGMSAGSGIHRYSFDMTA